MLTYFPDFLNLVADENGKVKQTIFLSGISLEKGKPNSIYWSLFFNPFPWHVNNNEVDTSNQQHFSILVFKLFVGA